jgi:hypothetical protein
VGLEFKGVAVQGVESAGLEVPGQPGLVVAAVGELLGLQPVPEALGVSVVVAEGAVLKIAP